MRFGHLRPQHWYDVSMGTSEAHISLTVNSRDNSLGCEIYIPDNKDLFATLQQDEEQIVAAIDGQPEWIEASKATRIKKSISITDVFDEASIPNHHAWLLENLVAFKKLFPGLIKKTLQE